MEARSYLENIANRTAMRGVATSVSAVLAVGLVLAAGGLVAMTNLHPAASIIAVVLVVGAVVLARDAVRLSRDRREHPLDLAFEPAHRRGLVAPGTVFGVAVTLALFGIVLGVISSVVVSGPSLAWAGGLLGVAAIAAAAGIPTLGVERRRWSVLSESLAAHPELVTYLQDARARFPASAPFPFQAPTDEVTIP